MDGSKYTVIEDSKSDKKSVLILSDININKWNFKNSEATYFLNKEFRDELVSKLRVPIDEIDEIRLLSIDDISNIIGVDNNKIESGLKIKDDYKFLYEGETITSGRSVNGVLKLGKEADTGLGIVGEDKPDNVSSVRVVIRLPKFFVTLN